MVTVFVVVVWGFFFFFFGCCLFCFVGFLLLLLTLFPERNSNSTERKSDCYKGNSDCNNDTLSVAVAVPSLSLRSHFHFFLQLLFPLLL